MRCRYCCCARDFFATREERRKKERASGVRERRSRTNARADRLRLSRARSLYLKQRTGILSAGIYFRSLVRTPVQLPLCEAKRSGARRCEARRGVAERSRIYAAETTRVYKASHQAENARAFLYRAISHSGDRLITVYRRACPINHVIALLSYRQCNRVSFRIVIFGNGGVIIATRLRNNVRIEVA